jgi:hypothetical protein
MPRWVFLILAPALGAPGLFLLLFRRASIAALRAIGLGCEPLVAGEDKATQKALKATTNLAGGLAAVAFYHLSIGWFIFGCSEVAGDPAARAVIALLLFGLVPGILAPYVALNKRWSFWAVLAVSALLCLAAIVINLGVLLKRPAGTRVEADPMMVIYVICYFVLMLMAAKALWLRRRLKEVRAE